MESGQRNRKMAKIKIRKGKDIRLAGMPSKHLECFEPTSCAIKPTDFIGVLPKLHVEEGLGLVCYVVNSTLESISKLLVVF